jgi:hypothetical protein
MGSVSYESILSRGEKLRLVRELAARVDEGSSPEKERSVLELGGLGATIWNGVDAQEYVNGERAAWNG